MEQFRVLYRQFLFRMVDVEALSADALGDLNKLYGQFASLLVFVSMLLGLAGFLFAGSKAKGARGFVVIVGMEHFLIATTMLVVGLVAVLIWDSTFPDRRDVLVLAPLPVRARTMFVAKVAATATALGLTIALFHSLAGIAWPLAFAAQATPQPAPALTFDPTPAPVAVRDLQAVMDRDLSKLLAAGALGRGTGAGMVIGASQHGERRIFTYGTAKTDSLFEIGSLSKTFTGLILARMVEQGKTRFDEPVRQLLPPGTVVKPTVGQEITLQDLATHHSGLPTNPPVRESALLDYRIDELYAFLGNRGVARPPVPTFAYSNLGFGLLGQALAERSGMSFPDLLREQVTEPLGLRDTVVIPSAEQERRVIQGFGADHRPVSAWHMEAILGAGGIRSTAGDLLDYLEANMHPERFPALAAAIREEHRIRAGAPPNMQIGLAWLYRGGPDIWTHNGRMPGYSTYAFYRPKRDYAVVILVNQRSTLLSSLDLIDEHIRQRLEGEPAVSLESVLIPAGRGLTGVIRWYAAYWFTMIAAGAFVYCGVLSVQGLAAQALPRRLFLRVSGFLQLAAFCLFLLVYFMQPLFGEMDSLEALPLASWLPPYWFLGLFHQLNGSWYPALEPLARRAWIGLAVTIVGTAVGYTLSYLRTVRRIVEEADIVPAARGANWLPGFGRPFDTAVAQFSLRTLARSRQHRLILAFYLGIGFALTIWFVHAPETQKELALTGIQNLWSQVNAPLMASSIVMTGFWMAGVRVVGGLPLDLRSNWIFRVTPVRGGPECLAARRRAIYALGVVPVWILNAALFLSIWPWRPAAAHLALLGALTLVLAEVNLRGPQKIPFTCSYLPGKSNLHLVVLGATGVVGILVLKAAEWERRALDNPEQYATLLGLLALAAVALRWGITRRAKSPEGELQFEEAAPALQTLGLNRDGALRLPPRAEET